MVKTTAGIEIPDSKLATEAADILREYGKADVCERLIPGYKSPNFCDYVLQSPWDDGKEES